GPVEAPEAPARPCAPPGSPLVPIAPQAMRTPAALAIVHVSVSCTPVIMLTYREPSSSRQERSSGSAVFARDAAIAGGGADARIARAAGNAGDRCVAASVALVRDTDVVHVLAHQSRRAAVRAHHAGLRAHAAGELRIAMQAERHVAIGVRLASTA